MNEGAARPVRVTYLIGSLHIGGAEQQLVRLLNSLDRSRFAPSVLCIDRRGPLEAELDPDIPVDGIRIDRLTRGRVRFKAVLALRILWTVARAIRRRHPDILHAYMPTAYVLGAVAGWSLRVPAIIASRRGMVSYDAYPHLRWRLLARFANRLIDVHLCNSEAVREYAITREGLARVRTEVVHNGIDLPRPGAPPALPEGWRRPGDTVLAVCVANLIHYKNHRLLLRAVARVVAEMPGFRLVLIGEGPERAALERQAGAAGIASNVVFAGSLPNAARLLPAFDLALLTSDEEGLPNVVMEAEASAVPVVATAVGGTSELITDGVEGLLVPPGDEPALAAAILRLARDPALREGLGAGGRERMRREFEVDRMVRSTEALYERLLGRPVAAAVPG